MEGEKEVEEASLGIATIKWSVGRKRRGRINDAEWKVICSFDLSWLILPFCKWCFGEERLPFLPSNHFAKQCFVCWTFNIRSNSLLIIVLGYLLWILFTICLCVSQLLSLQSYFFWSFVTVWSLTIYPSCEIWPSAKTQQKPRGSQRELYRLCHQQPGPAGSRE